MSKKIMDRQGRFRGKLVSFRMSKEENEELNRKVALSGYTKQTYIINSVLDKEIVVLPSPYVIRSVKREIERIVDCSDDEVNQEMKKWLTKLLMAFNEKAKVKLDNGDSVA